MEGCLIRLFRSIPGRNFPRVPKEASPSDQKNLEWSAPSLISFDISSCLVKSFLIMEPANPHLIWGFLTLIPFLSYLFSNLDPAFETSSSSFNDQPSLCSCRFRITAMPIMPRLTFFAAAPHEAYEGTVTSIAVPMITFPDCLSLYFSDIFSKLRSAGFYSRS